MTAIAGKVRNYFISISNRLPPDKCQKRSEEIPHEMKCFFMMLEALTWKNIIWEMKSLPYFSAKL
jgi:hypothetical protein